jgi:hypothetical protein
MINTIRWIYRIIYGEAGKKLNNCDVYGLKNVVNMYYLKNTNVNFGFLLKL